MTDIDPSAVPDTPDAWRALATAWAETVGVRSQRYTDLIQGAAAQLDAAPQGPHALAWTLGVLTLTARLEGAALPDGAPVAAALSTAAERLGGAPCDHADHPYLTDFDVENLNWRFRPEEMALRVVGAGPPLDDPGRWSCPRNVAGFARAAAEAVSPGTFDDVPVRAPASVGRGLEYLSGVIYDHPHGDPYEILVDEARALLEAAREDTPELPGLVVANCALLPYAVSERVESVEVLDEIITALEAAARRCDDVPACDHSTHPDLDDFEDYRRDAELMLTPGGRRAYRWRQRSLGGPPLEAWTCRHHFGIEAEIALDELREARAEVADEAAQADEEG
ncbi:hypothetical protein BKA00_005451 [Actinomadura coerulea]|uniref:Uncharacterized protein n=1 Tax=Actinomadura coerulea TaxID=46159 RepID=A0A7X0L1H9_9ACTN|nr:hypothetical protein [Actinomadura coerulea]MBB6398537.1 hypothetical protein [Actinomadura coerulea]GGQ01129.1 hypothetical protein GCM10010187_16270 [Actinomadura coerulea]